MRPITCVCRAWLVFAFCLFHFSLSAQVQEIRRFVGSGGTSADLSVTNAYVTIQNGVANALVMTNATNLGVWTLNGTNNGGFAFSNNPATSNTAIGTIKGAPFLYFEGLNNRLGVLTNNPQTTLHMLQGAAGTPGFRLDDTNGTPRVYMGAVNGFTTAGGIYLGNSAPTTINYTLAGNQSNTELNAPTSISLELGSAVKAVLTSTGVGIFTNNPANALHILQGSAGTNLALRIDDTNGQVRAQIGTLPTSPAYGAIFLGNLQPSSTSYALLGNNTETDLNSPQSSTPIVFNLANVEKMRLAGSTGNLGIGTGSPPAKLTVTADNSQALISQRGTTNFPAAIQEDTNGVIIAQGVRSVQGGGFSPEWDGYSTAAGASNTTVATRSVGIFSSTGSSLGIWGASNFVFGVTAADGFTTDGGNPGNRKAGISSPATNTWAFGNGTLGDRSGTILAANAYLTNGTGGGSLTAGGNIWTLQALSGASFQLKNADSTHYINFANSAGSSVAQVFNTGVAFGPAATATVGFPMVTATNGDLLLLGGDGLFGGGDTNRLKVFAGGSSAAVSVGGILTSDVGSYTNLNGNPATFTNLGTITISANALTNNGDSVQCFWSGFFQTTAANTNEFKIATGALTLLDTGLQLSSNGTFKACATITRRSATSLAFDGVFTFNGGTQGNSWSATNAAHAILTLDTGTNNVIALQGAAQRVGAHTNDVTFAEYKPAR